MTTQELIQSYYDSLNRKDERWQELYSDNAVFSDASQTLNAKGKEAVIQSFTPFLKGVAGVRIKQLIVSGDTACAVVQYTYQNAKGERMDQAVAEVWETKDSTLTKLTIYFDLTAYRSFIRG